MSYGPARTRYSWNFSKILILSGQMIDFYHVYITHVFLFTLAVFLFRLAPPLWAWLYIYHHVVSIMWLVNFIDFIDFKTSNAWYLKTTCPIELKLTGSIVWANRSLYIDFQVILNFHKNSSIFNFKGHRYVLWSCKHTYKLKEF